MTGARHDPRADARAYRLSSLDMVRGLAVVVMALDHVRDYVMLGAQQDPLVDPNVTASLFFTRWVTHYCAPTFVFLAGTSAGLMAGRKTPSALGAFLFTRGVWLVAIEWLVISTAWTFAPWGLPEAGGLVVVPMQVIWALGASMIVLAGVQFLGRRACLVLGAAIVVLHNLLDPVWPMPPLFGASPPLWVALHAQMSATVGPFFLVFAYPVLPWIGVMLLGFGASPLFEGEPGARNRRLAVTGFASTAAFVVLRAAGVYGDPNPWAVQGAAAGTLIDFLNTTKYPPSLLFLLMTLGPAALLCSVADRVPGPVRRPLVVFGRVPFAFYVAHLYLIHALSVGLGVSQGFDLRQLLTIMLFYPEGFGVSLPVVYIFWAVVVLLLYPLCRRVASVKARRSDWWLSYV